MEKRSIKSVVTHYGEFHADDVFAVAILKILYPKIKVHRVEFNDIDKIESADIRVDIGRRYDPQTMDFDHHQIGGAGVRPNSIPYASCGLVWHHFGIDVVEDERVFEEIDRKLMQTIDALDSNIEISEVKIIRPYTISDYIMSLNPQWPDDNQKEYDKRFEVAVEFAINVLKTEIMKIKRRLLAEERIKEYIKVNAHKNYLIIEEDLPWREFIITQTSYKYIIELDALTKRWNINAVPLILDGFDRRHTLPKKWGGLRGKELENACGVKGAVFCHIGLFFACAQTKEAAIEMVEIALGRKKIIEEGWTKY